MPKTRTPLSLLTAADRALRAGRADEAFEILDEIEELHDGELQGLAARTHMRRAERSSPRTVHRSR